MSYLWKVPATMGAAQALYRAQRDTPADAFDEALRAAEKLAKQRAKRVGYKSAIIREDVEQAFADYGYPLQERDAQGR